MGDCKCLRGPQGEQGEQGETGDTGATGPAFTPTRVDLAPASMSETPTVETIVASAAATGTLVFWITSTYTGGSSGGQYGVITVTPKVNGVAVSNSTCSSAIIENNTITVCGLANILITQAFTIEFELDDNTYTVTLDTGNVLYYIA